MISPRTPGPPPARRASRLPAAARAAAVAAALLAATSAAPAAAEDACQVAVERTAVAIERRPVPWGGEVDISPTITVDCDDRVPDRITVTEDLPDAVQLVPGFGRAPDRVAGRRHAWELPLAGVVPGTPVTFTYRVYLVPALPLPPPTSTLEVDWPMELALDVEGTREHPPGPPPDPLVVTERPGARDCDVSLVHTVVPGSVLPGEPFEVQIDLVVSRCRLPGPRHRAVLVVPPASGADGALVREAAGALAAAVRARDPGDRGQLGLVVSGDGPSSAPSVEIEPLLARLPAAGRPGDAAADLSRALDAIPDWPGHHEVVYLVTTAAAPRADPGALAAAIERARDGGAEVVPVCVGGGCDPGLGDPVRVLAMTDLAEALARLPAAHAGTPLPVRRIGVREGLPPYVRLEPGSPAPAAEEDGDALRWQVASIAQGGRARMTYRAHVESWGRFPVGSPSRFDVPSAARPGARETELALPGFVTVRRDPAFEAEPCRLEVDKSAEPPEVPLGDPVTIRLRVRPYCHEVRRSIRVVVTLDRSGSMGYGATRFGYVKLAARALAEMLAVDRQEDRLFGLISHGDPPVVELRMTGDPAEVAARIDAMVARGQDNLAQAIVDGTRMLVEARTPGEDPVREVLVVLSDGGQTYPPESAAAPAEAARAAGIQVVTACARTEEHRCDIVSGLAGAPEDAFEVEDVDDLLAAFADMGLRLRQPTLPTVTIVDDLPAHMRFEADSARPIPAEDNGRRLVWRAAEVGPLGLVATYRAVPLLLGRQPTNAFAEARYRDRHGREGGRPFPVPEVTTVVSWPPDACAARVTHAADRSTAAVGDPITATMSVRTDCPDLALPLDVVVALDRSDSMNSHQRWPNALAAVRALLDTVDPAFTRVGLVAFTRQVDVAVPPTTDLDAVRRTLDALRTGGTTDIEPALRRAHELLRGDPRDAGRLVVLLTDGITLGSVDGMVEAARALREDGVFLATVCAGTCDAVLPSLASRSDLSFQVDEAWRLVPVFAGMRRTLHRLYPHDLSIALRLGSLVELESGSPVPAPDRRGVPEGDLVWLAEALSSEAMTVTYRVRALAPGRVPVGIALLEYRYADYQWPDRVAMPVPVVDVTGPTATATPSPAATATLAFPPTPTPTPVPGRTAYLPWTSP